MLLFASCKARPAPSQALEQDSVREVGAEPAPSTLPEQHPGQKGQSGKVSDVLRG